VLLALSTLSALWWTIAQRPTQPMPVSLVLNPPAGTNFTESGAVVSPDGQYMAFVAAEPGKQSLWIRPLRELQARELAGTVAAQYPFWSPDSQSIGFFAAGKLRRIRVSGGPPEDICDVTLGRGGAWSKNNVILFGSGGSGLRRVPADGGHPVAVTELNAVARESEHRWPQFLPDGERFLFWILTGESKSTGVYVASLSAPQTRIFVAGSSFRADYAPASKTVPGRLFWVRGSTLVAQSFNLKRSGIEDQPEVIREGVGTGTMGFAHFSVSNTGVLVYGTEDVGRQHLEMRSRTGDLLGVAGPAGEMFHPRFSPDGSQLAMSRVDAGNSDLWIYDFARRVMRRITFDPGYDNYPAWSPNGRQIAFSSSRGGRRNIFVLDLSRSSSERRLTESSNAQYLCDWSPDGRYLSFIEMHPTTGADLWLLRVDQKDAKPELFLGTQFEESDAVFAPDGKWIAYRSNESGRAEVYIQPFPPTGAKWLVSDRGGSHPRWRRDGRELFYVAADSRLMSVATKLWPGNIGLGTPRELLRVAIRLGVPFYDYDSAADGSHFVLVSPAVEGVPAPMTVLLNWQSAIGR
jgi:eukaryotic-like serine/threonine-protein kinase